MSGEERLGEVGFLSLKKRRLRVNLILFYSNLIRGQRDGGARLFSKTHDDRAGSNGHKLKHRRF